MSSSNPSSIDKATPMMRQYLQIKEENKDCLVFFRMGDFYELFFEDAIIAAPILEVALTRRGKTETQDIPMCGVPHHSCELYVQKLIKSGFKVAICDQLESPAEARERDGHKAVVKRGVIRIITPGTITEDNLLEGKTANYLLTIFKQDNKFAFSYADISTLEFKTCEIALKEVANEVARINPSEIIIADSLILDKDFQPIYNEYKNKIVTFVDSFFNFKKTQTKLKQNYNIEAIEAFGNFTKGQVAACGALIEYICITQKREQITLNPPVNENRAEYMIIDSTARKNLELFTSINENGISLFKAIDKTQSNAGGRLLKKYLAFPSINPETIKERQNLIDLFLKNPELRKTTCNYIKQLADIERAASKIAYKRANPLDLYSIKNSLIIANSISKELQEINNSQLKLLASNLLQANNILNLLNKALIEREIYLNQNDYISPNFHPQLKELYNFRNNSKNLIAELREEYRTKTGISGLKIEFNNVIGYYIEVTKTHLNKISTEEFIHRQTMVNASRFITDKLKDIEGKVFSAKEQIELIESQIFTELSNEIITNSRDLKIVADALAYLDVVSSFAELANENNYCQPEIDNSKKFEIINGRHPVVEKNVEKLTGNPFIANNCKLENSQKLWLITGPNMAGKSTFLRQNALIAIMAQIGSFVPAESASIGIIDRVFSRVGAGDDLAQGRSTFLVEMIETATILNQATDRSLIILDEIGRGTSTYDGLAIAWSCLEYIHDNLKCRTIFATHYHELTELSNKLKSLKCYTTTVKEWEGKVIFMHKLAPGIADRSYGINVAELAGIPPTVITRAKSVLHELHDQYQTNENSENKMIDLFNYKNYHSNNSELKTFITKINPDELTPKEALETIYQLKKLL